MNLKHVHFMHRMKLLIVLRLFVLMDGAVLPAAATAEEAVVRTTAGTEHVTFDIEAPALLTVMHLVRLGAMSVFTFLKCLLAS
jgi:hypothetical protein|tara:strand:- start:302 stop:550 length:249 start_codon:yes stop_codon:yes gene_type:complete